MSKRYRFIYTRTEGGPYFRGFEPLRALDDIIDSGLYRGKEIYYLRWQSGNYDFVSQRPRVEARETTLSELWYNLLP